MLDMFTIDAFAPRVGNAFQIHVGGDEPLGAVLENVAEIPVAGWRPEDAPRRRKPFSLLFLGPAATELPQAIYRFEHEDLGPFEIFIVPVGRSGDGVRYEAVFS